MANPTNLLQQPIANLGTRNTIPNATTNPGIASIAQGFPAETAMPLEAGGYAPLRQDMNGLLYILSTYAMAAQRGIVWQYDATIDYQAPAFVQDADDSNYYFCLTANGPSSTVKAPHADTAHTYWKPLSLMMLDIMYPVGAVYISVNAVNPSTLFGGTWEQIEGCFLLASGQSARPGSTEHTIGSVGGDERAPVHNHGITINSANINHNHSANGTATTNGAHTHTRGTMEITGTAYADSLTDASSWVTTGAFYDAGRTGHWNSDHANNSDTSKLGFAASRSWTGATSSNGNHTHNVTVTVNNTTTNHTHTGTSANAGSGTSGNMPPYLTVNVWKRTA